MRSGSIVAAAGLLCAADRTNDVCVEVFFDARDTMHWAVPNHIDGLEDVGSPTDQGGVDRGNRNRALPDA